MCSAEDPDRNMKDRVKNLESVALAITKPNSAVKQTLPGPRFSTAPLGEFAGSGIAVAVCPCLVYVEETLRPSLVANATTPPFQQSLVSPHGQLY